MTENEPLTVEKLLALPFVFVLHANAGRDRLRLERNPQYGLTLRTELEKNRLYRYRVNGRFLVDDETKAEVDVQGTPDRATLEAFCEQYNAAREGNNQESSNR